MRPRAALGALVGGLGLVLGVIGAAIVTAVVLVALGLPTAGRADDGQPAAATEVEPVPRPARLVIGLQLGDARLQAGVVRDGEVVLARGLEVDVVRALSKRLRFHHTSFVNVEALSRVPRGGGDAWHLAVTTVRPTRRVSSAGASLTGVYLPTGPVVVQRRAQHPLRTLAELRGLRLCALRGTDAARATGTLPRLAHPLQRTPSSDRLFQMVQTGVCDAALVDIDDVAAFVAGRRGLLGPIAARLDRGEGLAVAVAGDSGLRIEAVDRALRRLRADGTLSRLARAWLHVDPTALRPLR